MGVISDNLLQSAGGQVFHLYYERPCRRSSFWRSDGLPQCFQGRSDSFGEVRFSLGVNSDVVALQARDVLCDVEGIEGSLLQEMSHVRRTVEVRVSVSLCPQPPPFQVAAALEGHPGCLSIVAGAS